MGRKKQSPKQNIYNLMVLKLFKELSKTPEARLSIREASRTLKIHPMAVYRAIRRIEPILDIKIGSEFESFRLPLKLIRLKPELEKLTTGELIEKVNLSKKLLKEIYKQP